MVEREGARSEPRGGDGRPRTLTPTRRTPQLRLPPKAHRRPRSQGGARGPGPAPYCHQPVASSRVPHRRPFLAPVHEGRCPAAPPRTRARAASARRPRAGAPGRTALARGRSPSSPATRVTLGPTAPRSPEQGEKPIAHARRCGAQAHHDKDLFKQGPRSQAHTWKALCFASSPGCTRVDMHGPHVYIGPTSFWPAAHIRGFSSPAASGAVGSRLLPSASFPQSTPVAACQGACLTPSKRLP